MTGCRSGIGDKRRQAAISPSCGQSVYFPSLKERFPGSGYVECPVVRALPPSFNLLEPSKHMAKYLT